MSNKSKGSNAERELVKLFVANGWRAVRVAGSGIGEESPCDIIAAKFGRKGFAIEVKSSKKTIYITKNQIEDFILFSGIIGLKPAIAARFSRQGWLFVSPEQLKDTGNYFALDLKTALLEGRRFSQFFEEQN